MAAAIATTPALPACSNAGDGAFSGAAIGTLGGLALGSLSGNAGDGAIIGLVSGAIAGGVIGDQNARQSRYHGVYATNTRAVYGNDRVPAAQQPVRYHDPYSPSNMQSARWGDEQRDHAAQERWPDEDHVDVDALIERHRQEIERLEQLRYELEQQQSRSDDDIIWHSGAQQAQRHYGDDTGHTENLYLDSGVSPNVSIYANSVNYYPASHTQAHHACSHACGCVYCRTCGVYHTRAEYFSRCAPRVAVTYRWSRPLYSTSAYYGWCSTGYDWRIRHGFGFSWSSRYGVRPFGAISWWYGSYDHRYSSTVWRPGAYWYAGAWCYDASYYTGRPWWYSSKYDRHRSVHASKGFKPTPPRFRDLKHNPTRDRYLSAQRRDRDDDRRVFASRSAPSARDAYEARRRAQDADRDRRGSDDDRRRFAGADRDNRDDRHGRAGVDDRERGDRFAAARRDQDAARGVPGENRTARRESTDDSERVRRAMREHELNRLAERRRELEREVRASRPAQERARAQAPAPQRRTAADEVERARRAMRDMPAPAARTESRPAPPQTRPQAAPSRTDRRPQAAPQTRGQQHEARPAPQRERPAAADSRRQQSPTAQPQRSSGRDSARTPSRQRSNTARPAQRSNTGEQRRNNNSRRGG